MAQLSIIIVSYNARAELERCLESLHTPPPTVDHQIVIVDNHSHDGSPEAARKWPDVRVIDAATNLGFARANNIGIRTSAGAYVLLLNSDTIVPAGAIDRLVAILDSRPDVAVLGPRLVDGEGRAELSFGQMLGPWTELLRKLGARQDIERVTQTEQEPDWVTGACLLVRRADAEAVGLLDERYFMYEEDVDFCASIRQRGRTILFTPAVEIVHLRGRSSATAPAATREAYHRSHLAFYEKHLPGWAWALRLWLRLRSIRVKPKA